MKKRSGKCTSVLLPYLRRAPYQGRIKEVAPMGERIRCTLDNDVHTGLMEYLEKEFGNTKVKSKNFF